MKPTVSDQTLLDAVEKELQADPEVSPQHISVTVHDGAVALGGHVSTIHEKHAAVRAAERIEAVKALADDIEVREPSLHERSDDEIAEEIAHVRGTHRVENTDAVGVQVSDGRVLLHGSVESEALRASIESRARQITGVRAVSNLIEVKTEAETTVDDVERRLQEALAQAGDPYADSVQVAVKDGVARLSGQLASLSALETAMHAAGAAQGVTSVESEIVLAPTQTS
jgi:osmotically-inducible protein OsmY